MITKVFQIVLVACVMGWSSTAIALAQNQHNEEHLIILVPAATIGATIGAFSVGFFEYSATWMQYCGERLPPADFILQYIKRYSWEGYGRITLGPAVGAIIGIIVVSQLYNIEGDTGIALVASFAGVNAGLGGQCLLARAARSDYIELISSTLPIGFAVLGAIAFYDAHPRSQPSSSRRSSLPPLSVTLLNLRF